MFTVPPDQECQTEVEEGYSPAEIYVLPENASVISWWVEYDVLNKAEC